MPIYNTYCVIIHILYMLARSLRDSLCSYTFIYMAFGLWLCLLVAGHVLTFADPCQAACIMCTSQKWPQNIRLFPPEFHSGLAFHVANLQQILSTFNCHWSDVLCQCGLPKQEYRSFFKWMFDDTSWYLDGSLPLELSIYICYCYVLLLFCSRKRLTPASSCIQLPTVSVQASGRPPSLGHWPRPVPSKPASAHLFGVPLDFPSSRAFPSSTASLAQPLADTLVVAKHPGKSLLGLGLSKSRQSYPHVIHYPTKDGKYWTIENRSVYLSPIIHHHPLRDAEMSRAPLVTFSNICHRALQQPVIQLLLRETEKKVWVKVSMNLMCHGHNMS